MYRLQEFQKTRSDICGGCGNRMILFGNSDRELHYKCLQCDEPLMRMDDDKPIIVYSILEEYFGNPNRDWDDIPF